MDVGAGAGLGVGAEEAGLGVGTGVMGLCFRAAEEFRQLTDERTR